jgi:hypothetical protein
MNKSKNMKKVTERQRKAYPVAIDLLLELPRIRYIALDYQKWRRISISSNGDDD